MSMMVILLIGGALALAAGLAIWYFNRTTDTDRAVEQLAAYRASSGRPFYQPMGAAPQ